MIRKQVALAAALALCSLPAHAIAQEKTAVRQGFVLPAHSGKRILLFRPTVTVGSQSAGGAVTANADWTEHALANVEAALRERQAGLGNVITAAPDAVGDQAQLVEEYTNLFAAMSQAVIEYQFFKGNRLPTKKRDNKEGVFDWSLGEGVRNLPGAQDADYALFIYNKDAYGTTGRKMLQVFAAVARIPVTSGDHRGYAGLIDLRTGDLLWLNADGSMGGDVREPDGARKRVGQLLEEFPGSVATAAAVPAARP